MRRDAQVARELLPAGTHWRGAALLPEGISILMEGDAERADPVLAHAYDVTSDAGGMPNAAAASTERALVAIGHGDWDPADTLVERALAIVRAGNLDEYAQAALVHPLAARCALDGGNVPAAREHLARAARLRPRLSYAIPFYAVQVRLEIVRAYLALGDPAGARAVMREVRDVFHQRPRLGVLPEQAAQLPATLDTVGAGPAGASSLTAAELRLLPLLPTHLSFREIGERLHISRHTVKTQAHLDLSQARRLVAQRGHRADGPGRAAWPLALADTPAASIPSRCWCCLVLYLGLARPRGGRRWMMSRSGS